MMGDSNGVSCKHWRSEMESKTTSGLKMSWKFLNQRIWVLFVFFLPFQPFSGTFPDLYL